MGSRPAVVRWIKGIAHTADPLQQALILVLVSVLAALLFYLPFLLHAPSYGGVAFDHHGMDHVYAMWDTPLYVTAAGTLWDLNANNPLYDWIHAPPADYAERFPLYPLAIRLLSPLFGYWNSALLINIEASTAATVLLYAFLYRFGSTRHNAFWVALAAIFWPPRGFLYRYVGMPEPLFILGLLGAVYFYKTSRFSLAGIFGAGAVAARPNSALVVGAFAIIVLVRLVDWFRHERLREAWRMGALSLMPLTLGGIYLWHQEHFGSWSISTQGGGPALPVPRLYPSLTFFGLGDEGVPYLFLLLLAGIFELVRRRHWDLAVLSAMFYALALFVPADVTRYLLPIFPFAFYLAGDRILGSVPVRVALLLSIPLVYAYAWTTLLGYQAPFGPLYARLP